MKSLTNNLPATQALALGIAFAANIGGASTPISSPQNIIAFQNMKNSSWGSFLGVSLPTTIISLLLTYGLLLLTFQTKNVKLLKVQPIKEKLTTKQIFICIVSLTTILLWCVMSQIENTFGEAGIISIISMVLFFGTGILNTSDINQYPYNIVFLACGGIALGKGLISSELLVTIAQALQRRIENFNVFAINIIFGVISVVIASFISHTVAALILIPLVKEVGQSLGKDHSSMLIFGTAMSASFAMSLPSSGFPNNTAISMVDSLGNRYLTVGTFIKRGFLATVICFVISITVGYGIMSSFGF
ncbi:PHO87 [Candida pseudojiufengensis]|uniref:PHO87 n=1 Tax=Candida pseudojiufengensis TaxID=497109 RepID=UPI002225B589|nr:PHO87 [Candida pseudojiufengensis]KAI5960370.1 PHO87 [Candida pseudojiufengensis]